MKDREMARRQQEVSGMSTQSNFMNCESIQSVSPCVERLHIEKCLCVC